MTLKKKLWIGGSALVVVALVVVVIVQRARGDKGTAVTFGAVKTGSIVGKVSGFAAGEQIFSARFLGTRGFVVTFRQIDPLFTFDLSVPEDPRLVGQVEIPGVSTYLHPLDDAHLLTIGYDGDQNRLNGQFQLQIFDVQNLADPRLLHKIVPKFEVPGFAWTNAAQDHLAFNYFPEGGTLTVCDNAVNLKKERPKAFETKAGSGFVCIDFQRATK